MLISMQRKKNNLKTELAVSVAYIAFCGRALIRNIDAPVKNYDPTLAWIYGVSIAIAVTYGEMMLYGIIKESKAARINSILRK